MTLYLDASAAVKLLTLERESVALRAVLTTDPTPRVVSSALLESELRRFAVRDGLPQREVSELLLGIDLVLPDRTLFRDAGLLPTPHLRTLDALHLATAARLQAVLVAYDRRLLDAAGDIGVETVSPA